MKLNIKQRIVAAIIYIVLLLLLGYFFNSNISFVWDKSNNWNMLLIVVALTIVLGNYITEPYFTKPTQVFTRWLAVFLFMIGLKSPELLWFYDQIVWTSIIIIVIIIVLIILSGNRKMERIQQAGIKVLCEISRPTIVFGTIYALIAISFYSTKPDQQAWIIGFGILLVVNKPVNSTIVFLWRIIKIFNKSKNTPNTLGKVIGFYSTDLVIIETVVELSENLINIGCKIGIIEGSKTYIGVLVNSKKLVNKEWITVQIIKDSQNNYFVIDNTTGNEIHSNVISLMESNDAVYLENSHLSEEVEKKFADNQVVKNINNSIGIVHQGSDINKILVYRTRSSEYYSRNNITEGSIIKTRIFGNEVLYQIIDAKTESESLEQHDRHGYLTVKAHKLGRYDLQTNELKTVKWVPEIYEPVYTISVSDSLYDPKKYIGRLPGTNYGIPLRNIHELVTHNTAILGILGIGKSCLTFEIIQKICNETDVKVICVDITNQYLNALPNYIPKELIQDDITPENKKKLKENNKPGNPDNPNSWGNEKPYKEILMEEITEFSKSGKRVIVMNPDWHSVSKAATQFRIQASIDLTAAEKTRIISEQLFMIAKEKGECTSARYLLVFEEAHSLVPEWNSIANEGDKNATNGTAKVILQGRKYGLGSLIITQRTANISKSILNQCNTIFAMRVFDDTGKQFLENYIGSDYSNLLPTLEERHAIAIGKALKLKQPAIIKLNDKNDLTL